jgi:hypothetical protein
LADESRQADEDDLGPDLVAGRVEELHAALVEHLPQRPVGPDERHPAARKGGDETRRLVGGGRPVGHAGDCRA